MRAKVFLLVFLMAGLNAAVNAQAGAPVSNYVVIGVFSIPENAQRFVKEASARFQGNLQTNTKRNLYYVYVLSTPDTKLAFDRARELRENSPYTDTWVFSGAFDGASAESTENAVTAASGKSPVVKEPVVKEIEKPAAAIVQQKAETAVPVAAPASSPTGGQAEQQTTETTPVSEVQPEPVPASATPAVPEGSQVIVEADGSKRFYFNLYSKGTQKTVDGEINIFDTDTDKRRASYTGNQMVKLQPINKSGKISAVCEIFGYRRFVYLIDFNDPISTEGVTVENGVVQVPFELQRLTKGDIQVMFQVFFFKDAAIMRPESRYEINALKEMLQENPNMKVRIHGHTNGNASGKIIEAADKNFYSLANSTESYGSAKKLSEERAEIIKAFLISEGIAADRMVVKAWGGKKPIFDKMHSQAQANVRVEIEVLSD